MILSAHQPAYLPWLGYFDKIARADVFVYLDTVQFEKNSFINRNRIKTSQGTQWLTVPVKMKGHIGSTLLDTQIDDAQPWRTKHLKSIEMNYRKVSYFDARFSALQKLILQPEQLLSKMCWQQLQFWLSELNIKTPVVRSSELPVASRKSDLVLDLCKYLGANHYISGALGRDYLDDDAFAASGVKVQYQNFKHPVYPQLWGDFEPYLSVVDYWMNNNEPLDFNIKEDADGF